MLAARLQGQPLKGGRLHLGAHKVRQPPMARPQELLPTAYKRSPKASPQGATGCGGDTCAGRRAAANGRPRPARKGRLAAGAAPVGRQPMGKGTAHKGCRLQGCERPPVGAAPVEVLAVGRLPVSKGSCRLRWGGDGNDAVRVRKEG
ncbi:hypothetical protein BHM03_00045668 [Ensete ventricosum]|nr:hypothetical protein BHM03_00045668 [Ensete ventricosum]